MPSALVRPASAHVHGTPDLEDVSTVDRARVLDPGHLEPERPDHLVGPRDLRPALDGPGPCEQGEIVEHRDRVLDERRVRQRVGRGHLADRPARAGHRGDVRLVLRHRDGRVRRHAVDVRRDSLGHPAARPSHERHPLRHDDERTQDHRKDSFRKIVD
jgi:hypothetical protein